MPKASRPPAAAKRRANGNVVVTIKGTLRRPKGMARALACRGEVDVRLRDAKRAVGARKLKLNSACAFARTLVIPRTRVARAKRLAMTVHFSGNPSLAPATRTYHLRITRRPVVERKAR